MFFFVISILTNCIEKMLFIRRTWENSQCSCWSCQSAASWSSGSPEKPTKLMLGLVRLHEKKKKKQKKSKVSAVTMQTPSVALRFHCTLHKTLRPNHADKCSSYGAQIRSTSGCRRTTCFLFTELDAADTAGKHDDQAPQGSSAGWLERLAPVDELILA